MFRTEQEIKEIDEKYTKPKERSDKYKQ